MNTRVGTIGDATPNLVWLLVWKDWAIMKVPVLCYWAGGFAAIALAVYGGEALGVMSFIIFIAAMAAAAVHCVIQTVVEERDKKNLPFIMSLPITIKEFTQAKILFNVLVFFSVWISLSVASLVIFIGDNGMPEGTLPFTVVILFSLFVAFVIILATALLSQSMGWTVAATVVGNVGTQLFLWLISDLHGIRSFIGGPEAVWNSTVVGILIAELIFIIAVMSITYQLLSRKQDFV